MEQLQEPKIDQELVFFSGVDEARVRTAVSLFAFLYRARRRYYDLLFVVIIASFAAGFALESVREIAVLDRIGTVTIVSGRTLAAALLRSLPICICLLFAFVSAFTSAGSVFPVVISAFGAFYLGYVASPLFSVSVAFFLRSVLFFAAVCFVMLLFSAECCCYRALAAYGRKAVCDFRNILPFVAVFLLFIALTVAIFSLYPIFFS